MTYKRQNGIYYTQRNIFTLPEFKEWLKLAGDFNEILEPFSGNNNLIKMFREAFPEIKANFKAFDISPGENICNDIKIVKRDTLLNYPEGYKIAIGYLGSFAEKFIFIAKHNLTRLRRFGKNVNRSSKGYAEAFSLTHGIARNSTRRGHSFALGSDKGARLFLFARVIFDETRVVSVGNEAYILTVGS